ncbi:MAG: hypothetical protein HRT89_20475, partial [Lentisphaeria bacterium]|nr:VOC family protein [Lentisphaeria bacterium]NQZ70435.1 hypothetical protein [Lentisphaeria bacterium]
MNVTKAKDYHGRWLDVTAYDSELNSNPLAISDIDCLEIYTGNAKQTVYYFSHAFGFKPVAYRGPETNHRDNVSYVLKLNKVCLIISAALSPSDEIAAEIHEHGLTVKNIALEVPDCEGFYYEAMRRGADSVEVPTIFEDEHGYIKRAGI